METNLEIINANISSSILTTKKNKKQLKIETTNKNQNGWINWTDKSNDISFTPLHI